MTAVVAQPASEGVHEQAGAVSVPAVAGPGRQRLAGLDGLRGLAALFVDLLTGGSGKTRVLLPDVAQPFIGGGINVTPVERTDAVNYLLGK